MLNFWSDKISDAKAFESWFRGLVSAAVASTHEVPRLKAEVVSPTEFSLSAEFVWAGILPDNTATITRTSQRWMIEDDPKERFARIRRIEVTASST